MPRIPLLVHLTLLNMILSFCSNYNNAVIDVFAELPGKNHLGLFKKAFTPKTPSTRITIRLSLDAGDQAIALLNIFWQITVQIALLMHD